MSIRKVAFGFIPTQVSGCALWFDATDSSTITLSSGSLTQWNDKSGNGRNLTAVSGYANATVSSAFQNGLNVFNFSGNGLYRTAGGAVVYPQDCYIVVALKSTSAHVDVLGMGDTGNDNFNSLTFGEYSASRWHNGSSGFGRTPNCVSSTTETSTSFLLMQWSIANNNFLLRRNGTQLVQTASYTYGFSNPSTSIFQIGFRHTNVTSANFSGYIGEIVVFNSQLGTTQQQQVESYLAQKWGLVGSLPGGHPGLGTIIYRAPREITLRMTPFFTGFTPRQISGLGLWLDSTDSSTFSFSSGSNISQWRDKSGSNHFSLTSGTTTTILDNGRTVVNFPSSAIMSSANQITFTTSSAFYIVSRLTSIGGSGLGMLLGFTNIANGGGSGGDFSIRFSTSGLYGTAAQVGNGQDFANGAYYINGTLNPSFGSDVYVNVYSIIGTVAPATGGTSFLTLSSSFMSRFFIGYIAEFLYYPAGVTSTQRQQIESYLAQKWGLVSSLPGGHLHVTQPAGARTALSLANSKFTLINVAIVATGGTITTVGSFKFHTFTHPGGTFTVTANPKTVEVLVVGGGGGGGGYYNGGGGGAGGAIYNSAFSVSITSYTVTVGNGGAGASGGNNPGINGTSGGATTFSTLTGNGGGGGGADNNVNGLTGGCGGGMGPLGATAPGSGNQGFAGGFGTNGPNMGSLGGAYGNGYGGGGGGGMGSVGSNALTSAGPGWGGTGFTYVVGGQNYLVAGGGGAGTADTNNTNFGLGGSSIGGVGGLNTARSAGNGAANTGSGGGGYGRVGTGSAGGTGGTGIVVIAYRI
jgi:hypothetical protein